MSKLFTEIEDLEVVDSTLPSQPVVEKSIVEKLHESAVATVVQTDEETKAELLDTAKQTLKTEFSTLSQQALNKKQKAIYDANKEACLDYGIEREVPMWQVRMMRVGSAMWFVIYFIIATVTIAPVNVFFKGIKSFIKRSWLAIAVSVLLYLFITIGMPLLIVLLKKGGIKV